MNIARSTMRRCSAVLWRDADRWNANSRRIAAWQWPTTEINKLMTAIERRCDLVDKKAFILKPEHFLSLRFSGEVVPRALHGKSDFKGTLYFAHAGDIIYSKIDVRNGAIGIVPDNVPIATVTSEFPVYRIKKDVALSEYIQLVFRTEHFRRIINGMTSGASGRKRVQPSDLEAVEIPLPPLAVQRAIVAHWRKAQSELTEVKERVEKLTVEIEVQFLADIGMVMPRESKPPKCLGVWWKDAERWDLVNTKRVVFDHNSSRYRTVRLANAVVPLSKTTKRVEPSKLPDCDFNYIGMENIESDSGKLVNFVTRKGKTIRSSCVHFNKEHILYGKLRPYLRKVVDCSELPFEEGIASSEFISLRSNEYVLQSWLSFMLRSVVIAEQAKVAIGARMPRISTASLLDVVFLLPPLDVQKQIMEHVTEGRAEISRACETIKLLSNKIKVDVEELILGTKRLEDL